MKEILQKLSKREDLTEIEAQDAMTVIMSGEATPAQVAAFLVALKMKGETTAEIYGCAAAMRAKAIKVLSKKKDLTDTCGTGGDGSNTFNISTTAGLIAAGAGLSVAKHGNRSVSSQCGSADVLEELGVGLNLSPQQMGQCLDEIGIAFLYAPVLHQAMKYAAGPRREVGLRSVFNVLGPLTNPAEAKYQVLGVYSAELVEKLAHVLLQLGVKKALVVHGSDGSDEFTLSRETQVCELSDAKTKSYLLTPEDVGLRRAPLQTLCGGGPRINARMILAVLQGAKGPERDVSVFNAGAALYVGGMAENIKEGVILATRTVDNGAALAKLEALRNFTGGNNNACANSA